MTAAVDPVDDIAVNWIWFCVRPLSTYLEERSGMVKLGCPRVCRRLKTFSCCFALDGEEGLSSCCWRSYCRGLGRSLFLSQSLPEV